MSKRVAQIESTLRRAVAQVLQRDLSDPRLEGALISVTAVKVSPDLHNATINVSVLPETAGRRSVAALDHASVHIGLLVRKQVAFRTVPRLTFRLDKSLKKEAAIHHAIREAVNRTGPEKPADPDAAEPDPDA